MIPLLIIVSMITGGAIYALVSFMTHQRYPTGNGEDALRAMQMHYRDVKRGKK